MQLSTNTEDMLNNSFNHTAGSNLRQKSNPIADGHMWLVHQDGYSACRLSEPPDNTGRCRVVLEHNSQEIEVDEEDLEHANSNVFDRVENLAFLRHLNESSILHTLRQRFGSNLIYTFIGPSLLQINPMASLSIYSEKVMELFRGCRQEDMPPHIYATAQMAYRALLTESESQAICLLGRSGSGKSYAARHLLQYFLCTANAPGRVVTSDKLSALWTLLEAFCCARTLSNTSASRASQLFTLDFDHSGSLSGLTLQVLMLERSRVARRPEGEPCFHVFYQMLTGLDETARQQLFLNNATTEPNLFMTPLQRSDDRQAALRCWEKIVRAADALGVSREEWEALCALLAVIFHLGTAAAVRNSTSGAMHFEKHIAAQKAATLLGCSLEDLTRTVFEINDVEKQSFSPVELLEGFVTGLYTEVVNIIVYLINRSLGGRQRSAHTITLLDAPGFQHAASCGRTTGATFEDLCYNYAQERLLALCHERSFTAHRDRYENENIEVDVESQQNVHDPRELLSLMDRNSTSRADANVKGLLWLLDEEAVSGTEANFVKRLHALYQTHKQQVRERSRRLLRRAKGGNFVLMHFSGTQPVQYNPVGWLKSCRELPTTRRAVDLLSQSRNFNLNQVFSAARAATVSSGRHHSSLSASETNSKGGSTTSSASLYRQKSVSVQFKSQMDFSIEVLRRAGQLHFVYCLLPLPNAGLCELRGAGISDALAPQDGGLNVPLLRQQVRGLQLLQAVRAYKMGFPEHLTFRELRRRFQMLLKQDQRPVGSLIDEKLAAETLVKSLELDNNCFRIGNSQVFFRHGLLSQLEERRADQVRTSLILFQAQCRGWLARRRTRHLAMQDKAIRCIQRNAALYMELRQWSWWRLLVKLRPIISARLASGADMATSQATEEELQRLRRHCEELEHERHVLQVHADQLEARVAELSCAVSEERNGLRQANDQLDSEIETRLRTERELADVRQQLVEVSRRAEKAESSATLLRGASEFDHKFSSDEDELDVHAIRSRFERLQREFESQRRDFTVKEEILTEERDAARRNLERKTQDLQRTLDSAQAEATTSKRRANKLQADLTDMRLAAEEAEARAQDVERRHKRLEQEAGRTRDVVHDEVQLREKLQRERDEAAAERRRAEKDMQDCRGELHLALERINRLNAQISDLMSVGGGLNSSSIEQDLMNAKRARQEAESRCLELEEELDELGAKVVSLEQSKLRAEMLAEKDRQQHLKEVEEREMELDSLRYATQKRVKQLEAQLEEELEEKSRLSKEKREVERQLTEHLSKEPRRDFDLEKRLRRDLKKTKALLKDANVTIEQLRGAADNGAQLRLLRNQLEEMEEARDAAIKSKRTMAADVDDLNARLEEAQRLRHEAEDRLSNSARERRELADQLEEAHEEASEVMRKYQAVVAQNSVDQSTIASQARELTELLEERDTFRREAGELAARLQFTEQNQVDRGNLLKLEARSREMENRLELEVTAKTRLQSQVERLKEQIDNLQDERETLTTSESAERDRGRRNQRLLREAKEEAVQAEARAVEVERKRAELQSRFDQLEDDYNGVQADLKLALKRISDLQAIIDDDMMSDADLEDMEDDRSNNFLTKVDAVLKNRSSSFNSLVRTSVANSRRNSVMHDYSDSDYEAEHITMKLPVISSSGHRI